jgi:hypothetical protein
MSSSRKKSVEQPPDFVIAGEEIKVYRLYKALYGMRKAPRAWNAKLDATLKQTGFEQSSREYSARQCLRR